MAKGGTMNTADAKQVEADMMPNGGGETVRIAYSPCPNDTFVFHAWAHGLVPDAPDVEVTFADIDITNQLIGRPDAPEVMKISYAALPDALGEYELLPCGGALGRGCGPLVLARPEAVPVSAFATAAGEASPVDVDAPGPTQLRGKTIAVPSLKSTAYLLFRSWLDAGGVSLDDVKVTVLPFDRIMPAVRDGEVDAGLVIHEARFTYPQFGLSRLTDLGEWWEATTETPIPLGAIIARRSLGAARIAAITAAIRASVEYAFANPEASRDYVMEHAQELDPAVAQAHIDLYVTEFSVDLGAEGYAAVERLLGVELFPRA